MIKITVELDFPEGDKAYGMYESKIDAQEMEIEDLFNVFLWAIPKSSVPGFDIVDIYNKGKHIGHVEL